MSFVSKAQQKYMFARHPQMAKEFAAKTPNFKDLPEHVRHNAIKMAAKRSK
jgi:hypothetical protein